MNIDKRKILSILKADLKAAEGLKHQQDSKIQEWRDAYEGNPYGNEEKGRSAIISRDIKRQSEWQHAALVDPFVSTSDVVKCLPVTFEDTEAARQSEILLNTQFCRKFDRFNFMSRSIKILDRDGTLIVQTGWDYEDEEVETEVETVIHNEDGTTTIGTETVTEIIVKRNQPTAVIRRSEDVYIDPTCQDNLDKAQFVIHRYETDLSTLRKDGRYRNLDKVAARDKDNDADYVPADDTRFEFTDEPRKKVLVHEYWGNIDIDGDGIAEAIVCAWVGDIIIRLEDNPYPDQKPPFLIVPFHSVPFRMHGESNAELIGDNQKVKTAILRGILNNMAQSNNGQVGLRKDALDSTNRSRFLQGKNFEFVGSREDFWQGSYNSIPNSVFDMLGLMNNEIESLSGTKSFSQGITGASLGSTATGARGALDATTVRRMHLVRNISENLVKPLMRKWMAYNAVFLEEEEVIRVTNKEYVEIRRDDLEGYIDIDIAVATAEDNSAKAQELSFLLQTLGPNEDPSIRRQILGNIFELLRMPAEAEALRQFEPQPDPIQEELARLQVENLQNENLKLAAQIEESRARAAEAQYDMKLKQARAEHELARARKIGSETDLKDLEFILKDEDIEGKRRAYELEQKRLHDLDVLAFQAQRGDRNIGVPR